MQGRARSYFFNILIALTAEQSKVGGVEIRYKMTMLLRRLENLPDSADVYKWFRALEIPKLGIFTALCGSYQASSGRVLALTSALF
jgi:hypothetical protein